MMSFMGSSGKGINEQEAVEEGEEGEEEQMMMRRESGKLPISYLSSSSTSHLQHTGVVVGNWLENKHSDDQKKQEDDESNEVVRQGGGGGDSGVVVEREHMFDKVVTPSDVGKLNRLVIPKQHAEKYFPLDSITTNSNDINKGLLLNFEDPNGKPWRFRYSYWNSSQSYVMTKGWSRFVKDKKLDAGDIVAFHRGLGDLFKHRLFIDWRRRPHATTTSTTLDAQAPHTSLLHHLHHPPGPSLSFPPDYFSFSGRSNIQQQYHLPYNPSYPWSSSSGGLLLHPPPPPPPPHHHPHTHTEGVAAMSSRDRHDSHSQYLTMQPSTNIHHHLHPYYNASNYGYMTSSSVVNNIINPTYSGGPVMCLRSATAAPAVPAGPQQQEGMMMMQMPRGSPDDEEGGVLLDPFVFDSVLPVVVQGKAAAAKRLRLFGVNMEYSPVEDEEEQEESHHHKPPPPP